MPEDITLLEVYKTQVEAEEMQPPSKMAKKNADGTWGIDWIGAKGQKGRAFWWNIKWEKFPVSANTWEPTKNVPLHLRKGLVALPFVGEEDEADDDEDDIVIAGPHSKRQRR